MLKHIAFGSALLVAGMAAHADVVLKNTSKYDINSVHVSPASVEEWGENVLPKGQTFEPGDKFTVTGVKPGEWDFRFTIQKKGMEEQNCDVRNVKIGKEGDVSELDSTTLNNCAEATAAAAADAEGEEEE